MPEKLPDDSHNERFTLDEAKAWLSDSAEPEVTAAAAGPSAVDRIVAWTKRRERGILAAAVALQLVVLLGAIALQAKPLITGDAVLLRVVSARPRDRLHGDSVILGYDFNRIQEEQYEGLYDAANAPGLPRKDRTVYIRLVPEPDATHWRAEKISFYRPDGGKFICATLTRHGRLECGIESYNVQDGTSGRYEEAIGQGGLSAEVVIDVDGRAQLRSLRIE